VAEAVSEKWTLRKHSENVQITFRIKERVHMVFFIILVLSYDSPNTPLDFALLEKV